MTDMEWIQHAWPEPEIISFERFMERCLYHPQVGYYERDVKQIGAQGDFLTCVRATPLFGRLLAWRLAAWLAKMPAPVLVEAGAHDGTLARDILGWLGTETRDLARKLQYWIIEPSPRRQGAQQLCLEDFAGQVRWVSSLEQLPPITGVIFSNELLDAFPVKRLGWDAEKEAWFEWGVRKDAASRLSWTPLPIDATEAGRCLAEAGMEWSFELGRALPGGYTVDLCPRAAAWWAQAANVLRQGRLLTVDYGFLAGEMFAPHRLAGTLRAYQGHRQFADVLARPGQRDLTAHVHFTQLMQTGERVGLRTEGLWTQERFFMGIARELDPERLQSLPPRGLVSLVHPDRQPFRVLVQRRDAPQASSD